MYLKYFLITLSIFGCATPREVQPIESKELLQKIIESQPTLSFSVKDISKRIKVKYRKKFNAQLNLSDPGSYYNKTDVVYKGEPTGMLLFSGTDASSVGFVLFEIKGITSQCYFMYYGIKGKSIIQMENLILKKQPHSFEDLKRLIIDKEFL